MVSIVRQPGWCGMGRGRMRALDPVRARWSAMLLLSPVCRACGGPCGASGPRPPRGGGAPAPGCPNITSACAHPSGSARSIRCSCSRARK
eukprot:1841091-Pyramimonas_sp.AAC.1